MKLFLRYLRANFKRSAKAYVGILSLTLVLLAVIALAGGAILADKKNDESSQKMKVGIVGDKDDKILNMGISLMGMVDDSRVTVEFVTFFEEKKAEKALQKREISSYIVAPKDFSKSLIRGENKKLNYVMAKSGASMSSLLTRDVIEVVSNYIVETQAGVTAMCDYAEDKDYSLSEIKALDYDMSVEYINLILKREKFVNIVEMGVGGKLSFIGYYICGLTVFFLLCFGIACCTMRIKSNRSLDRLLYAKGFSVLSQTLAEYIPYFCSAFVTLLIPLSIAGVASNFLDFGVVELEYFILRDYIFLGFKLLPIIFVITSFQFLLYELVSGVINSVLLQFIASVILGYISGCFYPIYFLPEAVQKISALLPSGVAIGYFEGVLMGNFSAARLDVCLVYGAVLVLLSVAVRKFRISRMEE